MALTIQRLFSWACRIHAVFEQIIFVAGLVDANLTPFIFGLGEKMLLAGQLGVDWTALWASI